MVGWADSSTVWCTFLFSSFSVICSFCRHFCWTFLASSRILASSRRTVDCWKQIQLGRNTTISLFKESPKGQYLNESFLDLLPAELQLLVCLFQFLNLWDAQVQITLQQCPELEEGAWIIQLLLTLASFCRAVSFTSSNSCEYLFFSSVTSSLNAFDTKSFFCKTLGEKTLLTLKDEKKHKKWLSWILRLPSPHLQLLHSFCCTANFFLWLFLLFF